MSWIWSINNLERIEGENHDIDAYYPGERFVDWVSTSGFNWGDAYSWSSWRTADPLYRDTYRALARFGKPIMISEIGTTGVGGDAAPVDPPDLPAAAPGATRACARCSGTTTSTAAGSTSASRARPRARSPSPGRSAAAGSRNRACASWAERAPRAQKKRKPFVTTFAGASPLRGVAPLRTAIAILAGVRTLKVFARKGTFTQTTLEPAAVNFTTF